MSTVHGNKSYAGVWGNKSLTLSYEHFHAAHEMRRRVGVNLPPALRPYSGSKLEVRLQEDNVRRLPLFLIFQIQTSVMLTHHNVHLRLIAFTQEFFRNRSAIHLLPIHCRRFHTMLNISGIEARRVDGLIVEAVAGDAKQHRRQPPGHFHLPVLRKKSTSLLPSSNRCPY